MNSTKTVGHSKTVVQPSSLLILYRGAGFRWSVTQTMLVFIFIFPAHSELCGDQQSPPPSYTSVFVFVQNSGFLLTVK